jgi:phosphatidate cytidylyltransferase
MKKEFEKRIYSSIVIIPLSLFFLIKGSVFFTFFLSILFLATTYEWIILCKKKVIYKILGTIFLLFSFYSAHQIRNIEGINYFILIILICIFTDIGGYIFGKFFKGPKLIKISPNKTYAGVFGGFLLALVAGLIYDNFYYLDIIIYFETFDNYPIEMKLFIFILIISLVSQIGDLIISYFKRLANVKDTGKIIPGHGGILDRIDGLIFAIPISYLIL